MLPIDREAGFAVFSPHDLPGPPAGTQLPQRIQQARTGEEIPVSGAGDPVVKLTPVHVRSRARESGAWMGKGCLGKNFDVLPPDDLLDALEGTVKPGKR